MLKSRTAGICLVAILGASPRMQAALYLNELLFNPAGEDAPFEFVELRGQPNALLPEHTCLVAVEGDAGANPGTLQNVFDLSGRHIGGNGFLLLLQKNSPFVGAPGATVLVNSDDGNGWGSGSGSSVGHRGEADQTDLENPSVTFFLIECPEVPEVGDDIDADDDGAPDGDTFPSWTILDSIGVLDNDGAGDIAYGAVTFRRDAPPGDGALASGTVVPVPFTPGYLARRGHTIGHDPTDWVASDHPEGTPPDWSVGNPGGTFPAEVAGTPLDSFGSPNLGAPLLAGVVLHESEGATQVAEQGATDHYTIALNTAPSGPVTLSVACEAGVEASADGGAAFSANLEVTLPDTTPREITVRAVNDTVVDLSPRRRRIAHTLTATQDPAAYPPAATLIPPVDVSVTDDDLLLLNEVNVNPPGELDAPAEFVELRGTPGALLTNVFLLAIDGNADADPGTVSLVFPLTGLSLGANGLLVLAAPELPHPLDPETTVTADARFNEPGGILDNGSLSLLLVGSTTPIPEGDDLDKGDNGVLEGLPADSTILDAVGWSDGGKNDLVFGGAELELAGATPDAATRRPGYDTPQSKDAWVFGELDGADAASLDYEPAFPGGGMTAGTRLTPGARNNTAPAITGWHAISGVIGDPTNPLLHFELSDAETAVDPGTLSAHSSNPDVVPDSGLTVLPAGDGSFDLRIEPVGVGHAGIDLTASDGAATGFARVPYAASEAVPPGGVWLLGASDGSTAIPVDANWMWVADDENEILRLYSRHASGLPFTAIDFAPFLDLTDIEDGDPREVDLEASTRVGNRLFWIGSHSHANIGESRTNRSRIFVTDLTGLGPDSSLTYVGRYDHLKEDLVAWDHGNSHGLGADYFGLLDSVAEDVPPKAPDGSGWSIEGLAMMPGSATGAYVAFRAPIVPAARRAVALIVPVLNFTELAAGNGPPGSAVFAPPIQLDLYGRGIRSLQGDDQGCLLIAGPAGPAPTSYPQDFRLYTWSGLPGDLPEERTADLTGLNPEAIVELPPRPWTGASRVQVISDNGQWFFYGDDTRAKSLPYPEWKKCRCDVVEFGGVVARLPVILRTELAGNTLTLVWRAPPAAGCVVEVSTSLPATGWIPIPSEASQDGPFSRQTLVLEEAARSFFRLRCSTLP